MAVYVFSDSRAILSHQKKVGRMIAKNNCKTSLKSTLKLDSRGGCLSSSLSPVKGFQWFRQQVLINKTNVTWNGIVEIRCFGGTTS